MPANAETAPRPPAVVTLHVWTVPTSGIAPAVARLALDRFRLRGYPGLTFAKLLGTGSGQTFAPQDADPHHWALLTCWDSANAAATLERSRVIGRWDAAASDRLRVSMTPLSSVGRWSKQQPFGDRQPTSASSAGSASGQPVASITRARIRPRQLPAFWQAVPDVVAELCVADGLLWSKGIGEAPIGLQGTFSVWRDTEALQRFAYKSPGHRSAIKQTRESQWFAEALFARFAVTDIDGTIDGASLTVSPWPS